MTMPAHAGGPRERVFDTPKSQSPAGAKAAAAFHAIIGRLFKRVLMMLAAGAAVADIMALKIAIYLPCFVDD